MLTVRTLNRLRDRFPTAEERERLSAYSKSLAARRAAVEEIALLEPKVVETALARLKDLYPGFARFHATGWEKGQRDVQLVLQGIAKSMLLDDVQLLDEQMLVWFRTILKSINFTPKFVRDCYTLLREAIRRAAKPQTFALMEPFLNHTITFLSDIPEPIRPEV